MHRVTKGADLPGPSEAGPGGGDPDLPPGATRRVGRLGGRIRRGRSRPGRYGRSAVGAARPRAPALGGGAGCRRGDPYALGPAQAPPPPVRAAHGPPRARRPGPGGGDPGGGGGRAPGRVGDQDPHRARPPGNVHRVRGAGGAAGDRRRHGGGPDRPPRRRRQRRGRRGGAARRHAPAAAGHLGRAGPRAPGLGRRRHPAHHRAARPHRIRPDGAGTGQLGGPGGRARRRHRRGARGAAR